MAGKRASMREGPLAALFRKTETEGLEDGPGTSVREPGSPKPRAARKPENAKPAEPASPAADNAASALLAPGSGTTR